MQTHYRGWIPTVTGRLSFSHFGDCTLARTKSVSRTDGSTRYLLVYQRRKIWDVMLPAWPVFEHALDFRGAAYFVCVAETEDIPARNNVPTDKQGALTGRVFIIANRKRWKKKTKKPLAAAIGVLDDFDAFPTVDSIQSSFETTYKELLSSLGEHCSFQCKFYLRRNGVIDIWADPDDKRAGDAPQFPTDHRQHSVVGQVFSFIRDAFGRPWRTKFCFGWQPQHEGTDFEFVPYEEYTGEDQTPAPI